MSESEPEIVAPTSGYYAARLHKIDKRLWPKSLKNIRVRLAEHAEVYRGDARLVLHGVSAAAI